MAPTVFDFIPTLESQRGDRYVFGAEVRYDDANPSAFDCSELTSWAAARVGVYLPDGARNQFGYCREHNSLLTISQGIATFGALLFRMTSGDHVAVSLGNGQTFEARGRAYGVNTFSAKGRTWTAAALVPGLDYSTQPIQPPVIPPKEEPPDMKLVKEWQSNHVWLVGSGVALKVPDPGTLTQLELVWGKATVEIPLPAIKFHATK